jgi:hypothetical protein
VLALRATAAPRTSVTAATVGLVVAAAAGVVIDE